MAKEVYLEKLSWGLAVAECVMRYDLFGKAVMMSCARFVKTSVVILRTKGFQTASVSLPALHLKQVFASLA